jgi:hypothetical protein
MRAGILISALSHVLLVLLALFGTPKLFDSVPSPSIEVDLVPSDEVDTKPKPPEPKKDKLAFDLPAQAPSPPPVPAQPPPPDRSQQAALAPQPTQGAPGPTSPGGTKSTSIFDPVNIPALLDLPNAPSKDFDSEAMIAADLTGEQRAAFKAQLRKCWKLPGPTPAANPRIVMRIYLHRDARLASDPVLISVTSPRDAIGVVEATKRALKDCQPFAFLPPEKYAEWRVLDLSLTPREMAGGG